MRQFGFGIVGTGMIAGVVAEAIGRPRMRTAWPAVSSRRIENAEEIRGPSGIPARRRSKGSTRCFARDPTSSRVYVATPTVAKEAIALAAIAAGKHVLVDKPFDRRASAERMIKAAAAKGLVFMDATHFVHNPRTAAIQQAIAEKIGSPRSLLHDLLFSVRRLHEHSLRSEAGADRRLGDMAWYSMRAVVEYLRPKGKITSALAVPGRLRLTKRSSACRA